MTWLFAVDRFVEVYKTKDMKFNADNSKVTVLGGGGRINM